MIGGKCVVTRQKRSSVNCGISKRRLSDRHPSLEGSPNPNHYSQWWRLHYCHFATLSFAHQLSCEWLSQQFIISHLVFCLFRAKQAKKALSCRALATNAGLFFAKIGNKKIYSTCQYIYFSWPAKQQTRLFTLHFHLQWKRIFKNFFPVSALSFHLTLSLFGKYSF